MARIGISEKEVVGAAQALVADGLRPSVKLVRERLGTGSPNTIHRILRQWQDTRPAPSEAIEALPVGLVQAISGELDRMRRLAREGVEAELGEARRAADELAAAGESLEEELEAMRQASVDLTTLRDRLEGRFLEQSEALSRMATELTAARAALEGQVQRAELLVVQLAERSEKLNCVESSLEAEREGRRALAQTVAVLESEKRGLQERLADVAETQRQVGTELAETRERERRLSGELAGERARLEACRAELETARQMAAAMPLSRGTLHLPKKGGGTVVRPE